MLKENAVNQIGIAPRYAVATIVLLSNAFIWYFCAFAAFKGIVTEANLNYFDALVVWSANFCGAALSALVGAILIGKIGKRTTFLALWTMLGVFSSLALIYANATVISNMVIFSLLLGVSFGLGMPVAMASFVDSTVIERRARFGGIILFINYAGAFVLLLAIIASNIFTNALILATWRILGLIPLFLIKFPENIVKNTRHSYISILGQKPFFLYFIPWLMFSLANSLSIPVQSEILGPSLVESLVLIENILVGVFAIIGGFLSDFLGRKRMAITGFVMIGLGYAILGIYSQSIVVWYFYTVVDAAAWGIFDAIFLMTIWGDIAHGERSEKYYALGGLPYLLSGFLQLIMGSYIAEFIPAYAIFSFTAFLLFLAVLPLMYAPETLPEKSIQDRELKQYIGKAKQEKEKYV